VRLKFNGCGVVGLVCRLTNVEGLSVQFEVVLYEDSVKEGGDICGGFQRAVGVELRGGPDDVVGLPFAWFASWIGQGNTLLVDAAGLSVHVGVVLVGVEDLELVTGVAGAGGGEKDAAVAACLAGAGDVCGDLPLEMELVVLESTLRLD